MHSIIRVIVKNVDYQYDKPHLFDAILAFLDYWEFEVELVEGEVTPFISVSWKITYRIYIRILTILYTNFNKDDHHKLPPIYFM